MTTYYIGKNKEIIAHSQLEARKIGYQMMKSSKYMHDYVPIYNASGKQYGEVVKSGQNISFKIYTNYPDKITIYPLKNNGEFKNPDLTRPYFYRYSGKTYRFKTARDARKSSLRLNPDVSMMSYDLDIFKETKSGYSLYQRLNIRGKGEIFCYLKEKFGFGLYKLNNNGELKKVR